MKIFVSIVLPLQSGGLKTGCDKIEKLGYFLACSTYEHFCCLNLYGGFRLAPLA